MKHKFLMMLLALAAAVCLSFGLAACDDGNNENGTQDDPSHVHSFTDYIYNNDATCTEDGTETATCSCGATDTRTKVGSAGHRYTVDNVCSGCGTVWEFTEGLQFTLDSKTDTYLVTDIGDVNAADITIPCGHQGKYVTGIGWSAFENCTWLESVTLPNTITEIQFSAFEGCSGLEKVIISDLSAWCKIDFGNFSSNPLYYAHHLYLGEEEIKDLVIPNDITEIKYCVFPSCSGLTSITIPNNVTSIGEYAFDGCSGLESVTIGSGVTSIGWDAFSGCSGLESITVDENNPSYSSQDGILYNKTKTEFVHIPQAIKGAVEIPRRMTSIIYLVFNRIRDTAKNQKILLKQSLSRA